VDDYPVAFGGDEDDDFEEVGGAVGADDQPPVGSSPMSSTTMECSMAWRMSSSAMPWRWADEWISHSITVLRKSPPARLAAGPPGGAPPLGGRAPQPARDPCCSGAGRMKSRHRSVTVGVPPRPARSTLRDVAHEVRHEDPLDDPSTLAGIASDAYGVGRLAEHAVGVVATARDLVRCPTTIRA
jgi:hypothetical protein